MQTWTTITTVDQNTVSNFHLSLNFSFLVTCSRISWPSVSFLAHMKHSASYRQHGAGSKETNSQ